MRVARGRGARTRRAARASGRLMGCRRERQPPDERTIGAWRCFRMPQRRDHRAVLNRRCRAAGVRRMALDLVAVERVPTRRSIGSATTSRSSGSGRRRIIVRSQERQAHEGAGPTAGPKLHNLRREVAVPAATAVRMDGVLVADDYRRSHPGLRGVVSVAAGGALLPGRARARGAGLPAAHAVPARPRPDRALEGVPAAQAQDAGVRGAGGRPLPDAADPHARGDADLPHRRAGAAPQRGPHGGDRAGPRRRAPAVRAHRRGGARRVRARAVRPRVPAQRALAAGGRDDRAAQPHRRGPGRDPAALVRCGRAGDAGGQDRPAGGPDRLHQPRHRRRGARRGARRAGAAGRGDRDARRHRLGADRPAGARPRRALRAGGGHRAGRRGRRRDAAPAHVHVRERLPRPDRPGRARPDRARAARAVRVVRRASGGAAAGRRAGATA